MQFKNRHHYILMSISLALAVVCAFLSFRVNVNSDMTKYLPDDSQMKEGLEILTTEFDASELTEAGVRVMFADLPDSLRKAMADTLENYPNVNWVNYKISEDNSHTLFELQTPDSINQKALGKTIRQDYPQYDIIVETSQDGATPPFSVIIIAAVLIIAILLLMAQSWLDPVIFLLSAGVAIVLNIGTNALLPSVSITTNYIGSILQLVLSLDFSIVLLNRYRQELERDCTPTEAVNAAVRRAFPPVISSALTTIVGLLVLVLMRLKIGTDMGVVLAKGVVCSLICTFTVLPSLLMLLRKGIAHSSKKTFVVPTNGLSGFVTRHKIPLAIFGILLFFVSWWFSRKTDIYFCTNGESRIEQVFPKYNPLVVLYPTSDEMRVITLADSLQKDSCVKMIMSYPTLLKQQYTADDMVSYISTMSNSFADYAPDMNFGDMLTPDMMRVVYFMRSNIADTLAVPFPDLMRFISTECITNPLFDSYINDDMRAQMALLQTLLDAADAEKKDTVAPTPAPKPRRKTTTPKATTTPASTAPVLAKETVTPQPAVTTSTQPSTPAPVESKPAPRPTIQSDPNQIELIPFVQRLYEQQPSDNTLYLLNICDTNQIHVPMGVDQMSVFIGSSRSQTKTVYSFTDGGKNARLTPMEYVHFLLDDLFKRKALQAFVSDSQKEGLRAVGAFMDNADRNATLSADRVAQMLTRYGIRCTKEQVIALNSPKQSAPIVLETTEIKVEELVDEQALLFAISTAVPDSLVEAERQADLARQINTSSKPRSRRRHRKTETERQAELFMQLMEKSPALTADSMSIILTQLGQSLDQSLVHLLYEYYGAAHCYVDSLTMTPEQLLHYVADTIATDSTMSVFLDEDTRQSIASARDQLSTAINMISGPKHAVMLVMTDLKPESEETYAFVDKLCAQADSNLPNGYHIVGESMMYSEMRQGFSREMMLVTLFTILAIFLIVAVSFRSIVVPIILVSTVMTAVFVNVIFAGIFSGKMLYLAYLIVQSILMGATIDYGILFANYYKEYRRTMVRYEACAAAYRGSIRTIMTSGLIMVAAPGVMSLLVDDVAISAIVGCLAIGALCAILLILCVLPAVLVALDRFVVRGSKSVPDKD